MTFFTHSGKKALTENNKYGHEDSLTYPNLMRMETNGVNVSEMNMLRLKKIEELTLYVIEYKTIKIQNQEIQNLKEPTRQFITHK